MKRLLILKEEIENFKIKKAQLQGKISSLIEALEKDFDCKTIEEAKKIMKELELNISNMDKQLEKELSELNAFIENKI